MSNLYPHKEKNIYDKLRDYMKKNVSTIIYKKNNT